MTSFFDRCPTCKTALRAAAKCVTCGFIAIAALDPHAHLHRDKFTPEPVRFVAVVASSLTVASDQTHIVNFRVPNRQKSI
jgi:hypothetical protein